MKRLLRIIFGVMLCVFICNTNVQGQIFKKALNKVKGAVGSVVGGKAGDAVGDVPKGPAKPIAPEVKNGIATIRSFTGLTEEQFKAKIKSLGFVEGANEMGMDGQAYTSKSAGFSYAVKFGTREGKSYVRSVSKGTISKAPVFAKLKATFLDFGKQALAVKATYSSGYIRALKGSGTRVTVRNSEDRTSKFLPDFDKFMSAKEEGNAVDAYREPCYEYTVNFTYMQGMAILVQMVTDLTVESLEG